MHLACLVLQEPLDLSAPLDPAVIEARLDHPALSAHLDKWENLDPLACKDLLVKMESLDLRETRVTKVCLVSKECLVQLVLLERRVHLATMDFLANPANLDPRDLVETTEIREPLVSLDRQVPEELREKKASEVPLEKLDHQVLLDLQVRARASIRQLWQPCSARAARRALIL